MDSNKINTTAKIKATQQQFDEMLDYYHSNLTYNNNPYVIARVKLAKTTITFYKTNVVLFQGEGTPEEYNLWADKYGLELQDVNNCETVDYSNVSAIGSDEVGTGDYYGPIVVCAAFVPDTLIPELRRLGVKDSKLLTDNQLIPIGLKISEMITYSVVLLEPKNINKLKGEHANFNFIKAYLHNKAICSLINKLDNDSKYEAIIVDEFTPKEKYFEYLATQEIVNHDITMIPKGEKAHIAVAAASIIARIAFLRQLKKYSTEYDMELLKGAGPEVDRNAISFVKTHGYDELANVAKLKFANTNRIKEYFINNPLPKNKQGHIND